MELYFQRLCQYYSPMHCTAIQFLTTPRHILHQNKEAIYHAMDMFLRPLTYPVIVFLSKAKTCVVKEEEEEEEEEEKEAAAAEQEDSLLLLLK